MSKAFKAVGDVVRSVTRSVADAVDGIDPLGAKILRKDAEITEKIDNDPGVQKYGGLVAAAVATYFTAGAAAGSVTAGAAGSGATAAAGAGSAAVAGGSYSATAFGTAAGYGGTAAAISVPTFTAASTSAGILGTVKAVSEVAGAVNTATQILKGPPKNEPAVSTPDLGSYFADDSIRPVDVQAEGNQAAQSPAIVALDNGGSAGSNWLWIGAAVLFVTLGLTARKRKMG